MLFHDDVMAEGKPEARPLSGGLRREKRVEHLLPDFGRYARAIVPDPDLDLIAEVPRCRKEGGLIRSRCPLFPLHCRVEAVRDQIEEHPGDLLRQQLKLACGRIKRPLDGDVEALLLGSRPVIGEVEALLDERIDVSDPALAGSRPRMQQHVLDDRIGALAVLHHLAEVAGEQRHQLRRLLPVRRRRAKRILQLVNELDR